MPPTITISSVTGVGTNPGSQLVITGSWLLVSGIRLTIKCKDEAGNVQTMSVPPLLTDPAIAPNPDHTFSIPAASLCGCGQEIEVTAIGFDGSTPTCQDTFIASLACDCCPEASDFSVSAQISPECHGNCTRDVDLTIDYSGAAKPHCPPTATVKITVETLAGAILNSSSSNITLGTPAQFGASFALPSGATYYVKLTVKFGTLACPPIAIQITLDPCDFPPRCPVDLALTAVDLGCRKVADECLSSAQFLISGDFSLGCGSQAATKLKLEYGDGGFEMITVPNAGSQSIVRSHHYSSGGIKTATVTIVNPTGCLPNKVSASVNLKACTAEDCEACSEPPEAPWWCLCKSCWLFSQKPGKWFCKLLMLVVIWLISMATLAILHGWTLVAGAEIWINLTVATAMIGASTFLVIYSKWCSDCCAACAIWPGFLWGLTSSIFLWIYYVPPNGNGWPVVLAWILRLISLILIYLALYWAFKRGCDKTKAEELTSENWCKEAK
jgi:hypothetical protein